MRPMPSHREDSIVEPDVISTTEATPDQRMADLDRRREAIKNHVSNRVFVHFVDEQSTFLQWHSHRMKSVIRSMMQNPSFQSEFVTALERNSCAKAA